MESNLSVMNRFLVSGFGSDSGSDPDSDSGSSSGSGSDSDSDTGSGSHFCSGFISGSGFPLFSHQLLFCSAD